MSESRICPVCDYEIPEETRFLCPRCHFELKWLDNEEEIKRAKQSFAGKWNNPYKDEETLETKRKKQNQIVLYAAISLVLFCLICSLFYYQLDAF